VGADLEAISKEASTIAVKRIISRNDLAGSQVCERARTHTHIRTKSLYSWALNRARFQVATPRLVHPKNCSRSDGVDVASFDMCTGDATAVLAESEAAAAAAAADDDDGSAMNGTAQSTQPVSDEPVSHHLSQEQLQPLYISMEVPPPQQLISTINSIVTPSTPHTLRRISSSPSKKCSQAPSARALPLRPTCRGMRLAPWSTSGNAARVSLNCMRGVM
jgi:hypothetical protein